MSYYTATRTILKSPVHTYFDTIAELNDYYGIGTNPGDYNKGYSFEYKGQIYLLGYEEDN